MKITLNIWTSGSTSVAVFHFPRWRIEGLLGNQAQNEILSSGPKWRKDSSHFQFIRPTIPQFREFPFSIFHLLIPFSGNKISLCPATSLRIQSGDWRASCLFLISLLSNSARPPPFPPGKITSFLLCNRPIKPNSSLMFVMPFSNPNPNPNLNSEPNSNPGVDPSFGTEECNRVAGAGVEVREQPLPQPDRDYGNG